MSGNRKEFLFKALLLGDGAVGKTSIRERYMGKGFSGSYSKTIGADFASKRIQKEGNQITLQIFDLAGQDAYVTARKSFYKGGQAAFLVFDVQDPTSLHNLNTWIEDATENSGGSVGTFIILGNKADLVDTRQVSNEMAIEFAQQLSAKTGHTFVFLETSAKTGLNIDVAFDIITNRLLRKFNIEVPLELPKGIDMISPSDSPGAAPVAQTNGSANGDSDEVKALKEEISDLNNRISTLEDRFSKLAQIVRNLVEKS